MVDVKKADEMSDVKVQLDENNQVIEKQEEKKEEPRYVTAEVVAQTVADAVKKATAPLYYELRQNRQTAPAPVEKKPEPTEWDKKLQGDWKGTVEEIAEARAEAMFQKREEKQRFENERLKSLQLLDDNKRKVLESHKELNDENSEKSIIYKDIVTKHPEYLNNPFGPVLAMHDMERVLRESGVVDEPTKQAVQKEVTRVVRANAGAVPKGSSGNPGTKTVVLSKEAKEFCDINGIKYQDYGKYSSMTANKGGVEV